MSFEEALAAQVAKPLETADVAVELDGVGYVVRVTQMRGLEWADAVDYFPPRAEVGLDQVVGYNLRTFTVSYLKSQAVLLKDSEPIEVTEAQWDQLSKAIDGGALLRIGDAVFRLNQPDLATAGRALTEALGGIDG